MKKIKEILKYAYDNYDKDFVFEKVNGNYESITFKDFIANSIYFSNFLLSKKIKNQNIVLYSENSANLMIADLGVLANVGVSVTVSSFYKYEEMVDLIDTLVPKCIIYSNSKNEEIKKLKIKYPTLTYISLQDDFKNCLDIGKKITENLFDFDDKDENSCSKIVFSSGTTSKSKAVMLSLKNIFSGWNSLYSRVKFNESDVCYLYLPLNHTYANIYNFLYSLISGMSIYLCSDIKKISEELLEVNPTVFCSVPYMYIKMLEVADKEIKYAFGNKIKYLFAGGSKLPVEIKQKYLDNGLFIMDAYALSETASSLCISYPDNIIDDSVGTIFEDIDVKISDSNTNGIGEILVKGDNVFLGYANNKELSEKVIDKNGYFHTGDIGYIKENKLYFVDRIKPILITSKGENIDSDKIKQLLFSTNKLIKDVNLYIKNDTLKCDIFVNNKEQFDWQQYIDSINEKLLKHEKIVNYDVIIDNRIKK